MNKRNLYLNPVPIEEALDIYIHALSGMENLQSEEILVQHSVGRVTSEAIYAKLSSPMFHASAMDGIAVIAAETHGASEANPLVLKNYQQIDTGDPIVAPYDAVIMAEDIISEEEGAVTIISSASPWQHIRPIGEDIVQGEMVLASKHTIRAMDLGVLLAAGILKVAVLQQPIISIVPTGTEIITLADYFEKPSTSGVIIESNAAMFEAMVQEAGGIPKVLPPVPDDYLVLKQVIEQSCEKSDLVILNAGSSAGREDYTVSILREIGEVFIHGVAIKPGKPVILAQVGKTPVIGLPGYPVSAFIDFELFVQPVLKILTGRKQQVTHTLQTRLSNRIISSLKHEEYVRVQIGKVGEQYVATPLPRGAGAAMSLVRADGFCIIPQSREGVETGQEVEIQLLKTIDQFENRIVSIGSHDLIMDIIGDLLQSGTSYSLTSMHVGSMGGILALKRGEAHIAPIHLLDEKSAAYNEPYLTKYLTEPITLIKGVGRKQGLMVAKGNPYKIHSLEDLPRVSFVNRQRGSGTRILLDAHLKRLGIQPSTIHGYEHELTTHMAVSAAVAAGDITTGLGVYSAAKAFDLDFIDIGVEEYDFAIPTKYLEMDAIQQFIHILRSDMFKEKLEQLGGYIRLS